MILLGGAVRATELGACTQRSLLDLPLDNDGTILNHWLLHAKAVSQWAALSRLPVRVMVNQNAIEPMSADAHHYPEFRVERDLSEYRGTGGVLHDLTADYDDDDLILVANAAQVLLEPLPIIAAELYSKKADVAVVAHEDGTPSGLMLIRCKALRQIASNGFVDMKEQALPLIASSFNVRVIQRRRPTGLPVRSLSDYIQALRFHHRSKSGRPASADPLAEDFSPTFSIVEPGAKVDASARLHDAVVLKDAVIERPEAQLHSFALLFVSGRRWDETNPPSINWSPASVFHPGFSSRPQDWANFAMVHFCYGADATEPYTCPRSLRGFATPGCGVSQASAGSL